MLVVSVCHPCDRLVTCPGCTPPLIPGWDRFQHSHDALRERVVRIRGGGLRSVSTIFLSAHQSNPFQPCIFFRVVTQFFVFLYCKILWRGLKFVVRKFTGRCELQRICYNNKHGARRTLKIGRPTRCCIAFIYLMYSKQHNTD